MWGSDPNDVEVPSTLGGEDAETGDAERAGSGRGIFALGGIACRKRPNDLRRARWWWWNKQNEAGWKAHIS